MATVRKPFQGVTNIVRFNRPFFLVGFSLVIAFLFGALFSPDLGRTLLLLFSLIIFTALVIPLLVSLYVYDSSGLYELKWLESYITGSEKLVVNINAGFDESSELLGDKMPSATIKVFDFYDADKHTEPSIKRAREYYPAYPGTITIAADKIPLEDNSADKIFVLFSAHEIRNPGERILFFRELERLLSPGGKIFVMEHLRDFKNFLAYNIGFLHFHSKSSWLNTFKKANLSVLKELKHTAFISIFILTKDGTTY